MSSYTKATNFASKDSLASGNPLKIVKGTEIDNEFNAIAVAVNTKIEGYNALLTGVPTAPTVSATVDSTQIATTAFVHDILPRGIILLWSGSSASIPFGWQICDGTNSTPNLRDRFVVGAGTTYAVNATGGSLTSGAPSSDTTSAVALTVAQMPLHGHPVIRASIAEASASCQTTGGLLTKTAGNVIDAAYTGTPSATGGQQIGGTGGGGTHSHTLSAHTHTATPPYYALCYIMKTTGI